MAEQWLSIVEYARTFAVSDMTVRRRIKTGRLKAVLRDGKYYIPIGPNGEVLDFDDALEASIPNAVPTVANKPLLAREAAPMPKREPLRETNPMQKPRELIRESVREPIAEPHYERNGAGASFRTLPSSLSQGLQRADQSLVDSQALLQFCDNSVTRLNSMEKQLHDLYQARIQTLESQMKWKDGIISQLKQQVEDLQMLVSLMEQSRR